MALIFFFGFVAMLVCGSAIAGYVFAIYALRPHRLGDLFTLLKGSEYEKKFPNSAAVGLALAMAIPAIGGVSYAVSGASWFVELFGLAGKHFWAWVAAAFVVGFALAMLLRNDPVN